MQIFLLFIAKIAPAPVAAPVGKKKKSKNKENIGKCFQILYSDDFAFWKSACCSFYKLFSNTMTYVAGPVYIGRKIVSVQAYLSTHWQHARRLADTAGSRISFQIILKRLAYARDFTPNLN